MCLCADRAEDGPTCIVIRPLDEDTRKSHFTWLLNMDVKVNPYALCSPSCRGIIVKASARSLLYKTQINIAQKGV